MNEKEIMSEEAFKELIDNLEIVEKLTPYGRKAIKYWVNKLQKENEEKDKRINDLEFALLDMVMQFANREKIKGFNYGLDTMGLSALELAFNELDFDEMYPVKKAEEKYKILEKQYYKN